MSKFCIIPLALLLLLTPGCKKGPRPSAPVGTPAPLNRFEKNRKILEDEGLTAPDFPVEKAQNADFSWRYERVWVMLWALNQVPTLGSPKEDSNPAEIEKILDKSIAQLMKNPVLRSTGEILDKLDLVQRYYGAALEAEK